MDSNRNRAAKIIGREYMDAMSGPTPSAWRGQIVEALDDAGVLAPDFTGSISENEAGKFFISKSTNIGAENFARVNNPDYWGNEGPVISVNSGFVNPTEARELAAAILAAADHAEKAAAHVDIFEYRIEHQHIENGVWHPLTQWSPEWPLNDGHSVAPDERIVCRRVSHPWEVTDG